MKSLPGLFFCALASAVAYPVGVRGDELPVFSGQQVTGCYYETVDVGLITKKIDQVVGCYTTMHVVSKPGSGEKNIEVSVKPPSKLDEEKLKKLAASLNAQKVGCYIQMRPVPSLNKLSAEESVRTKAAFESGNAPSRLVGCYATTIQDLPSVKLRLTATPPNGKKGARKVTKSAFEGLERLAASQDRVGCYVTIESFDRVPFCGMAKGDDQLNAMKGGQYVAVAKLDMTNDVVDQLEAGMRAGAHAARFLTDNGCEIDSSESCLCGVDKGVKEQATCYFKTKNCQKPKLDDGQCADGYAAKTVKFGKDSWRVCQFAGARGSSSSSSSSVDGQVVN